MRVFLVTIAALTCEELVCFKHIRKWCTTRLYVEIGEHITDRKAGVNRCIFYWGSAQYVSMHSILSSWNCECLATLRECSLGVYRVCGSSQKSSYEFSVEVDPRKCNFLWKTQILCSLLPCAKNCSILATVNGARGDLMLKGWTYNLLKGMGQSENFTE